MWVGSRLQKSNIHAMGFLPVPTTPTCIEMWLTPNVKQCFSNLINPWDYWSSCEKECFPILWVFDLALLDWGQTVFISNKFPGDMDTTFGYPTLNVSGLQQQWQLFGFERQDNDRGNYFYVLPHKNYSEL